LVEGRRLPETDAQRRFLEVAADNGERTPVGAVAADGPRQ
jgi:hypothetical protein